MCYLRVDARHNEIIVTLNHKVSFINIMRYLTTNEQLICYRLLINLC